MLNIFRKLLGLDLLAYKIDSLTHREVAVQLLLENIKKDIEKMNSEFLNFKEYIDDRISMESEELSCEMNDSSSKTKVYVLDSIKELELEMKRIKDKMGIIDMDVVSVCNDLYTKTSNMDMSLQVEKWINLIKTRNSKEQKLLLKELRRRNSGLAGKVKNELDNMD